ncbi:MAG: transposase, partial [Solirubrobacteraceae bacterium]
RVIYTTNSIEALHRQLRKIIKTRGHFPTEDAARKLIYLAITKAETKWVWLLQDDSEVAGNGRFWRDGRRA